MFIVENYHLAVSLCFITMLCWGSWANTQKLVSGNWRFELFYWDYVIGIFILSLIMGFTLGNHGELGRGFIDDLGQLDSRNFGSAFIGGVIFNAANILLTASVSLAGMSVAFPVGVGLALVLGVFINYFSLPKGDPITLFIGVALIAVAIILNGFASSKVGNEEKIRKTKTKGLILAIIAGFLMSFFYQFVASAMDVSNFENPAIGKATPYTAFFIFSLGILGSNIIFNTLLMKKPFDGTPVTYTQYFKGKIKVHSVGILGGIIWGIGTSLSYIAAGKAGTAISYALGQGAPMIAALWGVFIWKEFKGSSISVYYYLALMFVLFILGLTFIIAAGNV